MSGTPTKLLRPWSKGDRITHERLTEISEAINVTRRGVRPIRQLGVDRQVQFSISVKQFQVVSLQTDYVLAAAWNGTSAALVNTKIALPYLLRRTPFDGGSRSSISYSYSDNNTRTATNGAMESITEIITPSYTVGDIIYAVSSVAGGVGVSVSGVELTWIDQNFDGRAWAKDPDAA